MLDIKFIRENQELIKSAAEKKRINFDISELIAVDDKRRELLSKIEEKRAVQNECSERMAVTGSESEKKVMISKMKEVKEGLQKEEEEMKEIMKTWQTLMLKVPNIPHMSVPEGVGEEENVEIKKWGEIRKFDFTPKNHIDLVLQNKMADFERGVKAHGFRGYFLINDGAKLSWAIWNYAREFFGREDFTEVIAPTIVRKEHFYGTGHLPNEAEDLFKTQDDDFLAGTAEVPVMAYHSDEILNASELPKKFLAFSPCFRREAGSYGKDTKGFFRVHEFYKFEQLILCEASHEVSERLHEEITRKTEEFIESLGLPYRRMICCTGDLSASKVKQYEIELFLPSENTYKEIASASYFHDFQTRRFNIRYDNNGKKQYVHSLNNTAIPTPRVMVALVEHYQNEDGTIDIPEVLRKYLGKSKLGI